MLIVGGCALILATVAVWSAVHALGLWLALLIAHGMVVQLLGPKATHLPMIAGAAIAVVILVRRQWTGITVNTLILFVVLLSIMALAGIAGMNHERSNAYFLLYAKGFLLSLLLAGCIKSDNDIRNMTLYCLIGLMAGVGMAIYQKATGQYAISNIYIERAASLRGDPNDTAMLFVAGVPLAVYWYMNYPGLSARILSAACLVMLLIGTVLTNSRGGFLTLLIVLCAIYLRRPSTKMTALLLLGVVLAGPFAPKSYWTRMESIVTGQEEHGGRSIQNRTLLLMEGTNIFLENPILGVGPGNFGCALMQRLGGSLSTNKFSGSCNSAAHNLYLEFFVENGAIGGILLLVIFYQAMRNGLKYDRLTSELSQRHGLGFAITLSLSAMLFAGLFLSQGKNSVLWFMTGLGLAMGVIAANKRRARLTAGAGERHIFPWNE